MPVVIATIVIEFLAEACKGLVGRVLVALGLGVVTAVGVNAAVSVALGYMNLSGLPAMFVAAFHSSRLDWFMSTVVSAITTRAALSGLADGGGLSFWVLRRGLPS